MRAFLYDKYGYYPEDEYATSFDYVGWHFQLELTDRTEMEVKDMKEFANQIPLYFPSKGSDILISRDGKYINDSQYGRVVLVATKNETTKIDEILRFHENFSYMAQGKELRISHLKSVWENKTDRIEEKILPKIKIDDKTYPLLIENCIHASGLAENAIQYLSDTLYYYGDIVEEVTLTHKRMSDLSSYTFLNPFNFILDSPGRDLADLIRYQLISPEQLFSCLSHYSMNPTFASLLLARLIYPTELYDMLEEYYLIKQDISSQTIEYYKKRKEKVKRIKKVHDGLVKQYQIRPIPWLENELL